MKITKEISITEMMKSLKQASPDVIFEASYGLGKIGGAARGAGLKKITNLSLTLLAQKKED